jgi:DNA (cytosine-5)-methyltransferase 1
LAQILKTKKPKAFLFENVKGLVHHSGGKTLGRIMAILSNLGYNTKQRVLNSKDFGVPQNRPRVYIVGFLGFGGGFDWPKKTDDTKRLSHILEAGPVDKKFYLSKSYWDTLVRHKDRQSKKGHGFGYDIKIGSDVASTIMCGGMGKERNLLIDKMIGNIPEGANDQWIRAMTPTEWERLQGYPQGWTSVVPDSVRMSLLGNSVTVNVIEAIAQAMLVEMVKPVRLEPSLFSQKEGV